MNILLIGESLGRIAQSIVQGCQLMPNIPEVAALVQEDFDLVILDQCHTYGLKELLCHLPITTKVIALVEDLPEDQMCRESGVIFLTPPIDESYLNGLVAALD